MLIEEDLNYDQEARRVDDLPVPFFVDLLEIYPFLINPAIASEEKHVAVGAP